MEKWEVTHAEIISGELHEADLSPGLQAGYYQWLMGTRGRISAEAQAYIDEGLTRRILDTLDLNLKARQ